MGDLTTQALLKEIRQINKGFSKSESVPTVSVFGDLKGAATTPNSFSLPARVSWARLYSATAFRYAPNSAATVAFKSVSADTAEDITGVFNGSLFQFFTAAAGSGATVFAFVQAAPDA